MQQLFFKYTSIFSIYIQDRDYTRKRKHIDIFYTELYISLNEEFFIGKLHVMMIIPSNKSFNPYLDLR